MAILPWHVSSKVISSEDIPRVILQQSYQYDGEENRAKSQVPVASITQFF